MQCERRILTSICCSADLEAAVNYQNLSQACARIRSKQGRTKEPTQPRFPVQDNAQVLQEERLLSKISNESRDISKYNSRRLDSSGLEVLRPVATQNSESKELEEIVERKLQLEASHNKVPARGRFGRSEAANSPSSSQRFAGLGFKFELRCPDPAHFPDTGKTVPRSMFKQNMRQPRTGSIRACVRREARGDSSHATRPTSRTPSVPGAHSQRARSLGRLQSGSESGNGIGAQLASRVESSAGAGIGATFTSRSSRVRRGRRRTGWRAGRNAGPADHLAAVHHGNARDVNRSANGTFCSMTPSHPTPPPSALRPPPSLPPSPIPTLRHASTLLRTTETGPNPQSPRLQHKRRDSFPRGPVLNGNRTPRRSGATRKYFRVNKDYLRLYLSDQNLGIWLVASSIGLCQLTDNGVTSLRYLAFALNYDVAPTPGLA
ncbi:hypothetical protein B0H11DRAFT_1915883 [Mycena galericulata]|nr:hypothetical protein B0H11DRAFT_1915883 [Mycena galericulata]